MTTWTKLLAGKEISTARSARVRTFITSKEKAADLPSLVDDGWEMIKAYKNPKFVQVKKDKPGAEQFEDRIWVLFANMGFTSLNDFGEFYIPFDPSSSEGQRQFSVFAADEETALVIDCKYSSFTVESNFYSEIKTFQGQIDGLRKQILKEFPGRKIKFIWATHNYILSHLDKDMFKKAGIMHFDDSAINYYIELVKHLGTSARYQLLGNLFAKQEIANMENRIPAIQGKMGGFTYYSFSIEPEKLLKIGYVLHRNEAHASMMPTYQRLIKKKRLQEVREFINDGGYFPNSIIISIDSGGKNLVFDQAGPKIPGSISKIGVLHIPKRYHSAYIIDGQHRLYGYSDSQYAATNSIPVVAFVDLDRTEQIKMFMDINENQKAVPKSLRVTLNADMLWDSDDFSEQRQALRSKIAQMLGEESTSPLQGRIVIGENESTPTKCITVEAMQAALKKTHFFSQYGKKNTLNKEGTFDCGNNQDSCDLFFPFIEKCLLYMREACLAEWEKGDNELGMLTINRGMQATIRVIDDIVNLLIEKGMVFPKMQSAEDIVEIVQYYLKPLAEYINTLSTEQRKDLRGYFGGGADTRFWRAYQKAIADKRPDFKPEGLDEYWMNEAKTYNDDTKNLIAEIEARLKRIISDSLEECFGDNWLIKGLPRQVYTRLKNAADDKIYEFARNGIDDVEVSPWDFVTLPECKEIAIYGKNWSTLFDSTLVRPEDASISGGKEAKTDWILRINTIKNKLSKSSYSVSLEEFSMVSGVHEWITSFLLM